MWKEQILLQFSVIFIITDDRIKFYLEASRYHCVKVFEYEKRLFWVTKWIGFQSEHIQVHHLLLVSTQVVRKTKLHCECHFALSLKLIHLYKRLSWELNHLRFLDVAFSSFRLNFSFLKFYVNICSVIFQAGIDGKHFCRCEEKPRLKWIELRNWYAYQNQILRNVDFSYSKGGLLFVIMDFWNS